MASELTPERWQAVERVYHAARDVDPPRRDAFLKSACAADEDLRREVESLLRYDTAADRYLERSALDESAASLQQGRSPLPAGRRIGGYEIVSLLGAGGMGDVYQARELRLGRDVALKVLEHSAAADSAWRIRFEEEARAASGLTHPNIVTIYGVGEEGDLAFIAMELVRGRTLREALAAGTLGPSAALDLASQLADALTAAHAAGIVHRDLKPENLMVTSDGLLKVLDFGIAKRHAGAEAPHEPVHPATGTLTQRGAILGTVGYMSPEQADGRQVDYRSDQFSFGAIVYEMLTGRRAFERSTQADTLEAIRSAQAPMDELGVGVPIQLRTIVQRCLAKRPEDRYAQTAEIARDLRRVREEMRRPVSPGGVTRRRALWMSGAAVASVAAAVAWRAWPWGTPVRSMAVLPFDNPDDTPGLEYLCDGITDSLIRRLGYVPELDVRPSSASLNFKQHQIDAATAGRQLGVDAVLAGAIRRRADVLEVSAGLVDVASGSMTWSATYQRRPADLPQLQQDLARAIVSEGVRRSLTSRDRRRFDRQPTQDDVALDLFLQGIHAHRQGGPQNYLSARRLLQQAVDRDPTFAIALVSLASTYTVMTIDGLERPSAAWPESNRLIRRALDIDPDLPEAHAEQASSWFFFDHDWDAAEREWNRAIHGDPSPVLPDLLNASALKLWALRRLDEATVLIRQARVLDPLTPRLAVQEGHFLRHAGRVDDAIRVYADVLDRDPLDVGAGFGLAEAWRMQGQFDRAIAVRRRAHQAEAALDGEVVPFADVLARARGERGYREIEQAVAMAEVRRLQAEQAQGLYVSPLDLARTYAQLGQAEEAFGYLDDAFDENSPGLVFLNVDQAWTLWRGDPRLDAAVRQLRLP